MGGVYTTLQVPELNVVLDVGLPLRSFASAGSFFLSHGHLDDLAGLAGLLNIRGLHGLGPAKVYLPAEIEEPVRALLKAHTELSRAELEVELLPMRPGEEKPWAVVCSSRRCGPITRCPRSGYQFLRRVNKLRLEYQGTPAEEIARLRKEGVAGVFELHEQLELAYVTDTLSRCWRQTPSLLRSAC